MGLVFKRTEREDLISSKSALSSSPNFHFNLPMNEPFQDGQMCSVNYIIISFNGIHENVTKYELS